MTPTYLSETHALDLSRIRPKGKVVKVGVLGLSDLIKLRSRFPELEIYAYEADPKNYGSMLKEATENDIKLMNVGLSNKDSEMAFYRYENSVSHSLFPRHKTQKSAKLKDTISVTVQSVNTMMVQCVRAVIDALILNCEGSEMPILDEILKNGYYKDIRQICVSFHGQKIYPVKKRDAMIARMKTKYNHHILTKVPKGWICDHLFILK